MVLLSLQHHLSYCRPKNSVINRRLSETRTGGGTFLKERHDGPSLMVQGRMEGRRSDCPLCSDYIRDEGEARDAGGAKDAGGCRGLVMMQGMQRL